MSRKRSVIKLATLRSHVTESQEWRIRLLADSGFAYRYIGKRVLNDGSDTGVRIVGRVLHRAGIRVRDYRNGDTPLARGVVRALLKKKQTA